MLVVVLDRFATGDLLVHPNGTVSGFLLSHTVIFSNLIVVFVELTIPHVYYQRVRNGVDVRGGLAVCEQATELLDLSTGFNLKKDSQIDFRVHNADEANLTFLDLGFVSERHVRTTKLGFTEVAKRFTSREQH